MDDLFEWHCHNFSEPIVITLFEVQDLVWRHFSYLA